jgi:hypothetical protein
MSDKKMPSIMPGIFVFTCGRTADSDSAFASGLAPHPYAVTARNEPARDELGRRLRQKHRTPNRHEGLLN